MRRRILIGAAALLGLLLVLVAALFIYIRSGRLDRFVQAQIIESLDEVGVRADIASTHLQFSPYRVTVEGLKLFPKSSTEPLATIDKATVEVSVLDYLTQRVKITNIDVSHPHVWIRVDKNGRSNLDELRAPPEKKTKSSDNVILLAAVFRLADGGITIDDRQDDVASDLKGINATLTPLNPASVEDKLNHTLALTIPEGSASYEGRNIGQMKATVEAKLFDNSASISKFSLESGLGKTTGSGEISSFQPLKYDVDVGSTIALDEIARIFKPGLRLAGETTIQGKITGAGSDYRLAAGITSGTVAAEGFRVRGIRINTKVSGHEDRYSGSASVSSGAAGGPDVDVGKTQFSAAISGYGTGFNVIGPLALESLKAGNLTVSDVRGKIRVDRDGLALSDLAAGVLGGSVSGSATLAFRNNRSTVDIGFKSIDVAQLAEMLEAKDVTLQGSLDGSANLAFAGFNYKSATGQINSTFQASVSRPEGTGKASATGQVSATATGSGFSIDKAYVETARSTVTASGGIDWDGNASLDVNFDSKDMAEVQRALDALGLIPDTIKDDYELQLAGKGSFKGRLDGNLGEPSITGHLSLADIQAHQDSVGSFKGDVAFSPSEVRLSNSVLSGPNGSEADFSMTAPLGVDNKLAIQAALKSFDLALIAKIGAPDFADFVNKGTISGSVNLSGLPGPRTISGSGNIALTSAEFNLPSEETDNKTKIIAVPEFKGSVSLDQSVLTIPDVTMKVGDSSISGRVTYNLDTYAFNLYARGQNIDLGQMGQAVSDQSQLTGHADVTIEGSGFRDDYSTLVLNAAIQGHDVEYAGRKFGDATITAATDNGLLKVNARGTVLDQPRELEATVRLKEKNYPVAASIAFTDTDVGPYLGLISPQLSEISGAATGSIQINGPLSDPDQIQAVARLTKIQLGGQLAEGREYTIKNEGDVVITATLNDINLQKVTFTGEGTSVTVGGTIARLGEGKSNLEIEGQLNLKLISSFTPVVYTTGVANVKASIVGSLSQPRLRGSADLKDVGVQVQDFPLSMVNGRGQIRFTEDQAAVENFKASVPGGGTLTISGGAALAALVPDRWRIELNAEQVGVEYPKDTQTVFDGKMILQGNRRFQVMSGDLKVRRASYTKDITLADLISTGGPFGPQFIATGPSGGGGPGPKVTLDIKIDADEAIAVHNNLADAVGSAHISLRGPISEIIASGRVTFDRGTVTFRDDHYEIVRSALTFPQTRGAEPYIDLQADSDISGYRVTISFSGPPSKLQARFQSDPQLPEADLIALILTGRPVGDTTSVAAATQTGLGLAQTLLSATLNEQLQRQTHRLFGLSRLSVDPLIVGRGADPTARVTVGQNITKDLTVTYSQNLTSGLNGLDRLVLVEYRLSNRLSVVATRDERGDVGFTVRIRKRF